MKTVCQLCVIGLFVANTACFGAQVSSQEAARVAQAFVDIQNDRFRGAVQLMGSPSQGEEKETTVNNVKTIVSAAGVTIAFVAQLNPEGYVIVAPDTRIEPIIGHSLKGNFPFEDSNRNTLLHLLTADLEARQKEFGLQNGLLQQAEAETPELWARYLADSNFIKYGLQSGKRYPSDARGLLIDSTWDQSFPWNQFCPLPSPSSGSRASVGCVATAMAQVVNKWQYPAKISFDSLVDSYEIEIPRIQIDSDSARLQFPSFATLNSRLSEIKYDSRDFQEKAYLSFAAGIKLGMEYSDDGSAASTPAIAEALLKGFSFGSARVAYYGEPWPAFREKVITNIKQGLPVVIGIKDGINGHAVVLEGYDEGTGEFLINLGWGGRSDSWYRLPQFVTGRFEWKVVSTVVYDIAPYQGWNQVGSDAQNTFRTFYAGPAESKVKWRAEASPGYRFKGTVVGAGNRIYAPVEPNSHGGRNYCGLWIMNQYGDVEKQVTFDGENEIVAPPVQSAKGEVFVGTGKGRVFKINASTATPTQIFEDSRRQIAGALKIDQEGRIYVNANETLVGEGDRLYCLGSDGKLLWTFAPPGNATMHRGLPAIDVGRGNVYIGYHRTDIRSSYLGCLDRQTGRLKFEKTFPNIERLGYMASPASIGADGTVYVGCRTKLYALDPNRDFAERWNQDLAPAVILEPPAIGSNGTLYHAYWKQVGATESLAFAARDPSNGAIKWEKSVVPKGSFDSGSRGYVTEGGLCFFSHYVEGGPVILSAYRDKGNDAEFLWSKEFSEFAEIGAFGPSATVYVVDGARIFAVTEGQAGNPYEGGSDLANNRRPSEPITPVPNSGAEILDTTVTLSWQCSDPDGQALKYDLFFGDPSAGDGEISPVATRLTANSYTVRDLLPGTTYIWRIIATDGQSVRSGPTWAFSVNKGSNKGSTGGTVQFNNRLPASGIDAKVVMPDGTGVGVGWTVQLYAGPEGAPVSNLQPITPTTTFRTGTAAGYVDPIDVQIPNIPPGGRATVVMRAYNGSTYETSTRRGQSTPITVTLGGAGSPPGPGAELVGLRGFTVTGVGFTIVASAGPNGLIRPSGTFTKAQGESEVFNAIPDLDYVTDQWTVDGIVKQAGRNDFTLSNIQANQTVSVSFKFVGVVGGGTVQFNNRLPASGIAAKIVMPDGTGVGVGWTAQLYAGPEGTPVNNLQPITPATTFRTGTAAGYVNPIDVQIPNIPPGGRATVVMRAYNGISYNASPVRGQSNPITLTLGGAGSPPGPGAELVGLKGFTVTGKAVTITASAGPNGSIAPSGRVLKNEGESQTFTATPISNLYVVDQWFRRGNLVQTGGTNYEVTNMQEGDDVYVTFKIKVNPPPPVGDLTGDGKPDIIFQDSVGSLVGWAMNGVVFTLPIYLNPKNVQDRGWRIVASGDFNRDSKEDLVFQHTDGSLAVWYMNGLSLSSAAYFQPSSVDRSWKVAAAADFNGDGKPDLLFQHDNGGLAVWHLNGVTLTGVGEFTPPKPNGNNWGAVGAADFNRDGKPDLLFQNYADTAGTLAVWYLDGTQMIQSVLVEPPSPSDRRWRVVGVCDRNGDSKPDILFQHDDGTIAVWFMDGVKLNSAQLVSPSKPGGTWRVVAPK